MTRQELAQKLDHLDPGAALKVDRAVLRAAFADASAKDMIGVLEAFAAEHRCTFSPPDERENCGCFEKDDVF
jgi:hypothetical protein